MACGGDQFEAEKSGGKRRAEQEREDRTDPGLREEPGQGLATDPAGDPRTAGRGDGEQRCLWPKARPDRQRHQRGGQDARQRPKRDVRLTDSVTLRGTRPAVAWDEADHEPDCEPTERGQSEGEPRVRIDPESVREVVPEHRLQPVLTPEKQQRDRRGQHAQHAGEANEQQVLPASQTHRRGGLLGQLSSRPGCRPHPAGPPCPPATRSRRPAWPPVARARSRPAPAARRT